MPGRIAVLDDFFPHIGSAFRFEEFRSYLDMMPNLSVHTTGASLYHADERRPVGELIEDHFVAHPEHRHRVAPLQGAILPDADLYYSVFVHIMFEFIDAIEQSGTPFAFTLYPGGGFALDEAGSDIRLQRVLQSSCFRRVIVTQPITYDYLIRKSFCSPDQIVPVYGGVLCRAAVAPLASKSRYGLDKSHLDVAFVANRYNATGADKGYDLFVDAAKILAVSDLNIRFHVVGRYDETILDLGPAADRTRFYGSQPTPFFDEFYRTIDMIVSPTRPFVLSPGAFDGFPTACSVEAGVREVAVICTDELHLNVDYVNGDDLIIVRPEVGDIVDTISALARSPARLRQLGLNARQRMLDVYSPERQLHPRMALLAQLIGEPSPCMC